MKASPHAVRRAAAAVLLSAFATLLAVPLLHAADEVRGPYCAGDHCCCAPEPGDIRTCFRSVCRCGTPAGDSVLVSLGPAVLAPSAVAFHLEGHPAAAPRGLPLPAVPDLIPPDHPPPAV